MDILETSKVLSDRTALRILAATQVKPCTAQDLSKDLETPLAGTYKKLKELEESGLIEPLDRILTSYGKRVTRYSSKVSGFFIEFYNNELRVTLETSSNDGPIRLKWNPLLNN
ncbi:MAG: helix-turn-helix domain-containing protein [Thermoplasmatota archaeon]